MYLNVVCHVECTRIFTNHTAKKGRANIPRSSAEPSRLRWHQNTSGCRVFDVWPPPGGHNHQRAMNELRVSTILKHAGQLFSTARWSMMVTGSRTPPLSTARCCRLPPIVYIDCGSRAAVGVSACSVMCLWRIIGVSSSSLSCYESTAARDDRWTTRSVEVMRDRSTPPGGVGISGALSDRLVVKDWRACTVVPSGVLPGGGARHHEPDLSSTAR